MYYINLKKSNAVSIEKKNAEFCRKLTKNGLFIIMILVNCKCQLDTRMNNHCAAQAGLDCHTPSTAGAVKDAAGQA